MDKKNIILILIVVIVILAAAMALMILPSTNAQENSKISIVSNKTLYQGDEVTVKLTNLNKTPIENESVNVVITDNEGSVVLNESLITNSKGKVTVVMDSDAGTYTVNATFSGNDNFTANSSSKKIKVEEVAVEEPAVQQSSESSSGSSGGLHYDAEVNVYYDDNGVIVDPDGEHFQDVGSSYADVRERRDKWERGEPVLV